VHAGGNAITLPSQRGQFNRSADQGIIKTSVDSKLQLSSSSIRCDVDIFDGLFVLMIIILVVEAAIWCRHLTGNSDQIDCLRQRSNDAPPHTYRTTQPAIHHTRNLLDLWELVPATPVIGALLA
jgi:hypothetical protein